MPVTFEQPLFLILLALMPVLMFWYAKHTFPGLSRRKKNLSLATRCLVMVLLVFCLAGISIKKQVDEISTIFVIDRSDSVTSYGKELALKFTKNAIGSMPGKSTAGIVVFGSSASVERFPSSSKSLGYISSVPRTDLTNIAEALNLGSIMFPQDSRKHLVLLSDGNENLGDTDEAIKLLKLNNIRVSAVSLPSLGKNEVIMTSFKTPPSARVGEKFNAIVKVDSDVKTEGVLQLFQNEELLKSVSVAIDKGINEYSFEVDAKSAGFERFKAQIEPKIDHWAENNEAESLTLVGDEPKIMVVEGETGEALNLVEALKNSSMSVTTIASNALPSKTAELSEYQAVILANVSADQLNNDQMNAIKAYVRDIGGGLIAIGGDKSFGVGEYAGTPIEDALPVKSDIESRRKLPSVAMVLVIDKSGSMGQCHCSGDSRDTSMRFEGGVSKVELAKVAVVQSAKVLGKNDYFGVVAVDDEAKWVVPLKKYNDKNKLAGMVGSLTANGGQVLEAGLEEAASKLRQNNAQIKHVILLTDGWTGMAGLRPIIEDMKKDKITFSTVAAGGGSSHLLKEFADIGAGRYYPMQNDFEIPKFITKETELVSRPYINQRVFYPKLVTLNNVTKGIGDSGTPPLRGYIATMPKGRSEVALVSDEDDPILATWQYGLGKSVAWLSDAKNQWSSDWVAWDRFGEFWSSLVRSCLPQKRSSELIASVQQEAKDAIISVSIDPHTRVIKPGTDISARIINPDNSTVSIKLEEVSDGKYEGRFEASQKGTYMITVSVDGTSINQMLGHIVSYSPEYRFREPNKALLTRLVSVTGGKFLNSPSEAFTKDLPPCYSVRDISKNLLLLAFILFFLDIALRRISISKEDIQAARDYIIARWNSMVSPNKQGDKVEKSKMISKLEEAKKRASKRWNR